MRRDANFGIGVAEMPKFKKKLERETDINFVNWIAEIQFLLDSFFR